MDRSCQRIELANRMIEDDGNLYFGPYTSKGRVEKAIQGLKEMFKMDCNKYSQKKYLFKLFVRFVYWHVF